MKFEIVQLVYTDQLQLLKFLMGIYRKIPKISRSMYKPLQI